MAWKPINTAPKDRVVKLRALGVNPVVMVWSERAERWVGIAYGALGPIRTFWDTTVCEPEEWAEVNAE